MTKAPLSRYLFLFISLAFLAFPVKGQLCKKHLRFTHLGPHNVPETTSDSGDWCPNGIGWIESLGVFDANRNLMYAGSNSGGLFKTIDGGKNWEFVFHTQPVTGVLDIVVDQYDPDLLWVASGTPVNEQVFSHGVLRSRDGGKNWQHTGLYYEAGDHQICWALERSNRDPNTFVATSNKEAFLSKDQCESFASIDLGEHKKALDLREVEFFNDGSGDVLISGNRLFLVNTGSSEALDLTSALTFQSELRKNSSPPDRIAISINPISGSILVLYKYNYVNYVDVSYDKGRSFENLFRGRVFSRVDRNHAEIAYDPSDTTRIYVGAVRMYRSDDHGKKFSLISRPLLGYNDQMHDDIRELKVLGDGIVYTGHDGGVSVSQDHGEHWIDISGKGLAVTQIYGIASSAKKPDELLIGCQDLGNFHFDGQKWTNLGTLYGDGGECLIGAEMMYVMQNGHLRVSNGDLKRWDNVQMPYRPDRLDYPLLFGATEKELLAADDHVWSLQDRRWDNLSEPAGRHFTKIKAMSHYAGNEGEIILIGKDQPTWNPGEGLKDRLFLGKKKDRTWEWSDITANLGMLAWRSVGDVLIHPENPQRMWVSLYGYDDGESREKVYYSEDGGNSWVNVSEGLPNINTYCLAYIPQSSSGILLGTDRGVYFRNDKTEDWLQLEGDMPELMVRDMDIQIDQQKVYIATYGNGVWTLQIPKWMRK